jgi:two-component system chemotaxis response regulator CheB
MTNRNILAIGTSAGGFEALKRLTRELGPDLPAAVLVVIHLPSDHPSTLDALLAREGRMPVSFAEDGEVAASGRVYIAPPGRHLLLDGDRLTLGSGPRENHARPAIDPLLRSVGLCCGWRAVGAVLTGTLGDGSSGLSALKDCGGVTVVQDPADAPFAEMPVRALEASRPHHVAGMAELPALLDRLVRGPAGRPRAADPAIEREVWIARNGGGTMDGMDAIGRRSVFTCPDCHGAMWEIRDGEVPRYRCHVGHAYSAELMEIALSDTVGRALASALRALEERVALTQELERQAAAAGRKTLAAGWAARSRQAAAEVEVIRGAVDRVSSIAAAAARRAV